MGFVAHHAIIVTSWEWKHLRRAQREAKRLGMSVTNKIQGPVNAYRSFLIGPDGSKEGWEDSDIGDKRREEWKAFVVREKLWVEWVEVNYGSDLEGGDTVTDGRFNYPEEDDE